MKEAVTVLALCGLTPQVVTETLWALLYEGKRISALHIVTTDTGKQLFDQKITQGDHLLEGLWAVFGHGHEHVPNIHFHIITNSKGKAVGDILSVDDHMSATELIGEKIWAMTRPDEPPLHASAAGGRKTMSIMLSTAMSLYARPMDRLSHVLVSPDIEQDPVFLYPDSVELESPSYIQLVDVPFPRLASLIPPTGLPLAMDKLIGQLDQRLSHLDMVTLDIEKRILLIRDISVKLPPLLMAVYLLFVRHRQQSESGIEPRYLDVKSMAECYRAVGVDEEVVQQLINRLSGELTHGWLLEQISRLKRTLSDELGPILARQAGIEAVGKRPRTCYRLRLPDWQIIIIPVSSL